MDKLQGRSLHGNDLFHFEIASSESSGIVYIKLNLQRLVVLQSPKVPLASFGYSAMA